MNTLKKRQTFTAEDKQKILDEFVTSPLSLRMFAVHKGIGESTLQRWLRKKSSAFSLNNAGASTPHKKPQLVAQNTTDSPPVFVELTQPFYSQFPTKPIQEHDQKTPLNSQSVGCLICVPNGITIKLESLVIDQLALVVKGLLP
jgi:transposase-like protein